MQRWSVKYWSCLPCKLPLYVQQLRAAATRAAWKDAAHTIKGSARAVGARRLASLAQVAEQLDVEDGLPDGETRRAQAVAAVAEGGRRSVPLYRVPICHGLNRAL